jgi:hypothetical protein
LKLKLVEDAPYLDANRSFPVIAVETVSHRHHTDAVKSKLLQGGKEEQGVSSQAGEVIDEHDIEKPERRSGPKCVETGPVLPGAGGRVICVDMFFCDGEGRVSRRPCGRR